MDAGIGNVKAAQTVIYRLHKRWRTAQIKIEIVKRQQGAQQIHIDMPGCFVILARFGVGRISKHADKANAALGCFDQFDQLVIKRPVFKGSRGIKQPCRPETASAKSLIDDMAQHRDHRCDTDATRDQNCRAFDMGID